MSRRWGMLELQGKFLGCAKKIIHVYLLQMIFNADEAHNIVKEVGVNSWPVFQRNTLSCSIVKREALINHP